MRISGVGHYRADIGKVEVDIAIIRDKLRDGTNTLSEYIIGFLESIDQSYLFVCEKLQSLVRNDDERVNILCKLPYAFIGLSCTLPAFKVVSIGFSMSL